MAMCKCNFRHPSSRHCLTRQLGLGKEAAEPRQQSAGVKEYTLHLNERTSRRGLKAMFAHLSQRFGKPNVQICL